MNKIPVLLRASREPKVGDKLLTTSDTVTPITKVDNGFAVFKSASGPLTQYPLRSLRWFGPLGLWAPHEGSK